MKLPRYMSANSAALPVDHLPSRYISIASSILALRVASSSVAPKLRANSAGISRMILLMLKSEYHSNRQKEIPHFISKFDLREGLFQGAGRLLQRHLLFRPKLDFLMPLNAFAAHDRRHTETNVANIVCALDM